MATTNCVSGMVLGALVLYLFNPPEEGICKNDKSGPLSHFTDQDIEAPRGEGTVEGYITNQCWNHWV